MIEIKHKVSGAILARVDSDTLCGASLVNAQLSGADLAGADLSNATLSGALLEHATFDGATLIGVCLDQADLRHASLVGANLTDASLQKAKLGRAQLNGCKLRYAKLGGAQLSRASMVGVDMSMADAHDVELVDANLRTADLRGTNLTDADLRRADFTEANLSGAILVHAITQGAQLKDANLHDAVRRAVPAAVEAEFQPSVPREHPHPGPLPRGEGEPRPKPAEFTSVSVKCPECDRPAKILRENLDNYVCCPDCKERYYVDRTGTTHAKKPVPETDWTPEMRGAPSLEHPDWELTPERVHQIKMITVISVSGLLAVLAVVIGLKWWGDGLPTEVVDRAILAGNAFANGDEETLLAVTAKGMEPDAKLWLSQQRSEDWTKSIEAGATPRVEASMKFTNLKSRRARSLVKVNLDPASNESNSAPLYAKFELPWQLDADEKWRIDARSLAGEP